MSTFSKSKAFGEQCYDILSLGIMGTDVLHTTCDGYVSFKMEWVENEGSFPDNADREAIQASIIMMSHGASNLLTFSSLQVKYF